MDIVMLIAAGILQLTGLVGCFLPVIPGPPLAYAGLLLVHFSRYGGFSVTFLIVMAVVALLVTVLDSIFPVLGAKKFGGTRRGIIGAGLGLMLGVLFFPPFGLVIGPFVGALIGELTAGKEVAHAMKASMGTVVGVLFAMAMKAAVVGTIIFYSVKQAAVSW